MSNLIKKSPQGFYLREKFRKEVFILLYRISLPYISWGYFVAPHEQT